MSGDWGREARVICCGAVIGGRMPASCITSSWKSIERENENFIEVFDVMCMLCFALLVVGGTIPPK